MININKLLLTPALVLAASLPSVRATEPNEVINDFVNTFSFTEDNLEQKYVRNIPLTPIKGIITLENLIEFWFKVQILDEEDFQIKRMGSRVYSNTKKKLMDVIGIEKMSDKLLKLYDYNNDSSELSNDYEEFREDRI